MYIVSVEINNFRSFYGYHNFDFKFQDKCNLNVIFGKNGAGKSIFIDAIYWCLYGKEILNFPTLPLYNDISFDEIDVGKELSVIVACKFEHNCEIFEVKRELSFTKNSNNESISVNLNPNLNIFIHNKEGNVEFRNGLFDMFPEFLFSFLFYDDESDFFDEQYEILLKKIIDKFCIFKIDTTNFHINSLSNHYIKELKKLDSPENDFGKLVYRRNYILKDLDETKNKIIQLSNNKQEIIQKIDKINLRIYSHSDEIKDLTQSCIKLSDDLKRINEKIIGVDVKYRKLLFKSFPKVMLFSQFSSNELDNLFNNVDIENINFTDRYNEIKQLYDDLKNIEYIRKEYEYLNNLMNEYSVKTEELNELDNIFNAIDDTQINRLLSEKKELEKLIYSFDRNLESLNYKKNSLEGDLRSNDRLMKRVNDSQFSYNIVQRRINFCNEAEKFGQELKNELFKQILLKIENYCNHIFFNYFDSNSGFKKIVLNDSFDIQMITYSNQILSLGDLSDTEKKLVRLSLIFSLNHALKLEFPIFLMNPFSKLDVDKIEGFFKFIIEEFDYQIIFILNNSLDNIQIKNEFLKNNVFYYQLTNYDCIGEISYEN